MAACLAVCKTLNKKDNMQKPKLLLVEDSPSLAEIYKQYLKNEELALFHVKSVKEALLYLDRAIPQVILLDLKLDDMPGERVLEYVIKHEIPSSVVIITAHGSVDVAVKLLHQGAQDFLQKPIEAARLLTTVRTQIENMRLKHLVTSLTEDIQREEYCGFVGQSDAMQGVYRIIESVATSNASVFITGESGTGKEVCAEAIHSRSKRHSEPFVALNCGAIPKDLMESEIFGHQKGAFTGAQQDREGAASQANGGTLFLDEIGEMNMDLQTKLLRFVQTGIIKKVGGNRDEVIDVRIICATNRDPLYDISQNRFREDLYYRLNVLPLHLPPLRERGGDVLILAKHFLSLYSHEEHKEFKDFEDPVKNTFNSYSWPGNVRQLQNVIRNIVVLHTASVVTEDHLPAPFNQGDFKIAPQDQPSELIGSNREPVESRFPSASTSQDMPQSVRPLSVVEREAIEQAITICDGNIPKAAALLDVSPSTIYRKKQAWTC